MRSTLLGGVLLLIAASAGPTAQQTNAVQGKKAAVAEQDKPWAFRVPVRPTVPLVKRADWVRNPIDAFVLAALEKEGLAPAPEADRRTLIRRLTFDLTGLPPTPEGVDAFVNDPLPDAYDRLVNRLLASPRYGERWALYWLDLVRFAESDGFKADDPRPLAWRYRDYVIAAFNRDLPYDRFLQEQLAGDELYPGDSQALVATGFNRHFPDEFNARNLELRRQEILNDLTDTTGQVFLGLTVGCARCHDHKYDPILQRDYYRLQAFFAGYRALDDLISDNPAEVATYEKQLQLWQEKTAALRARMDQVEAPYRQKLADRDKSKFAKHLQDAYDMPAGQRTPLQQQLADMVGKQVKVNRDQMTKSMKSEVKKEWDTLASELAQFDDLKPQPLHAVMALREVGPTAPPTFVLQRGNYKKPLEEVQPGFLEIFDPEPARIVPPPAGAGTTGRRAALAVWLTRPDHPLTGRVMVNRLWQHHFGHGIVATPSDFGEMGTPPTHPELLDWLAMEFVKQGWSLKAMHRLMVTSSTYRQSTAVSPEAAKLDPDNKFFSRMTRKRLEGEALRDAMLLVSGRLNGKMGGPGVFPELPPELGVPRGGWPTSADPSERVRRSIYVFAKRNLRYPLFGAFDAPEGNESCARRHVSISAPQALMLLNSKMTLDWARALAGRVLTEVGADSDQVIDRAYRLALARQPTAKERALMSDFLGRESKHLQAQLAARQSIVGPVGAPAGTDPAFGGAVVDLCHVVLNLNEFAYVD
jgi:hypothetical protein